MELGSGFLQGEEDARGELLRKFKSWRKDQARGFQNTLGCFRQGCLQWPPHQAQTGRSVSPMGQVEAGNEKVFLNFQPNN